MRIINIKFVFVARAGGGKSRSRPHSIEGSVRGASHRSKGSAASSARHGGGGGSGGGLGGISGGFATPPTLPPFNTDQRSKRNSREAVVIIENQVLLYIFIF